MNTARLTETVAALMAGGRSLIAVDECLPTCNKRFEALDVPRDPAA